MVDQFRDGFDKLIQLNPTDVVYFPYGTTNVQRIETVRFSHESSSVPANTSKPVGLDTNFSMFVELYHDSGIVENDVLIDGSQGWKVGAVDSVKFAGEVYGKHAPLTKLSSLGSTKAITSFKIGLVSGVIAGTNITVTLPVGTDISALVPVIVYNGKMITPTTAQDFTEPVTYTVTAENLSTQNYIVTVVLA
jgi:hypothetical protein